jgi:o-succinylbenzoate---CoA ligase
MTGSFLHGLRVIKCPRNRVNIKVTFPRIGPRPKHPKTPRRKTSETTHSPKSSHARTTQHTPGEIVRAVTFPRIGPGARAAHVAERARECEGVLVPRLVALALPAGDELVRQLQVAWDRGDAVTVVDLRLPAPARQRMLDALAPSVVMWPDRMEQRNGVDTNADDALVVPTSGSTGEPKGVVLTHDAVRASAMASSEALQVGPSDHWLACLPLAHIGGLSVVTRALATNTALTVLPSADPISIDESPATLTSVVATVLARIDPTRWRRILLGGSAPPPNRPANVLATYGMTETGSGIVYDGRALPGVSVRVDGDQQIWVKGAMMLRAYRNGVDPKIDGWLPTGDLGAWDGETLQVFGRRGDMITTGGEKVWPAAVEQRLLAHPAITEAVVVAVPDAEWGQRVVAHIVANEDVSLDEVRAWVSETLPRYSAPRQLVRSDGLPRLASGKINRAALTTRGTWT